MPIVPTYHGTAFVVGNADTRWSKEHYILIFSLYTTLHDAHGAHLHEPL